MLGLGPRGVGLRGVGFSVQGGRTHPKNPGHNSVGGHQEAHK